MGSYHNVNSTFHGTLAAALMFMALVIRFGVPIATSGSEPGGAGGSEYIALLTLAGGVMWVWGCCHLAKHFGLSPAWGLFGLFFILGVGVIFWASRQKPAWDRAAAMRPRDRRTEYRGDPDSPY